MASSACTSLAVWASSSTHACTMKMSIKGECTVADIFWWVQHIPQCSLMMNARRQTTGRSSASLAAWVSSSTHACTLEMSIKGKCTVADTFWWVWHIPRWWMLAGKHRVDHRHTAPWCYRDNAHLCDCPLLQYRACHTYVNVCSAVLTLFQIIIPFLLLCIPPHSHRSCRRIDWTNFLCVRYLLVHARYWQADSGFTYDPSKGSGLIKELVLQVRKVIGPFVAPKKVYILSDLSKACFRKVCVAWRHIMWSWCIILHSTARKIVAGRVELSFKVRTSNQ